MKYDVTVVPAEMMNVINNLQRRKRKKICLKIKNLQLNVTLIFRIITEHGLTQMSLQGRTLKSAPLPTRKMHQVEAESQVPTERVKI